MESKRMVKINHEVFHEAYEGLNGDRRVLCILDENCVRYLVIVNGKLRSRREFSNGQEKTCLCNAERALNK